jgi:F-type H+-transporting ATPase subunit b
MSLFLKHKNLLTIFFALWYSGFAFRFSNLLEGRCKMLNFDWTFIALAINFIVLLFLLNAILFKPLLKIFKERDDTVKGNLDSAKDMTSKREESIAALNRDLAEARSKAKETFESFKGEAVSKQKEVHSAAEVEAATILEKARAEIKAEAEKARNALRADVDKFSDEIVRKLVKA